MIKGIKYPIEKNPKGFMYSTSDIDQIKSNLLVIILTFPGERVMEPSFGTPLHLLDFTQPISVVTEQAKMMIARSIKEFEKRIQVEDIKVNINPVGNGQYDLRADIIMVDLNNIQRTERFSLETTVAHYVPCGRTE